MKQLLCFGDSNTWGLIPGTNKRYPYDIRWTGILNELIKDNGIRVIEEGLCGRTSTMEDPFRENRNGLKLLPFILEAHYPIDFAIIMLGTNDCKTCFNLTAKEISNGISKCIDLLSMQIKKENILLISPILLGDEIYKEKYDPDFCEKSIEVSKELANEYKTLAKEKGIHYLSAQNFASPSNVDQEHLSPDGHKSLALAIYKTIIENKIINN